ncbi:MAG: hypothetical protein ACXV8O_01455 [Methylobacter sp.]
MLGVLPLGVFPLGAIDDQGVLYATATAQATATGNAFMDMALSGNATAQAKATGRRITLIGYTLPAGNYGIRSVAPYRSMYSVTPKYGIRSAINDG